MPHVSQSFSYESGAGREQLLERIADALDLALSALKQ